MAIRTITVPAAGEKEMYDMTGLSIAVIDGQEYETYSQAAKVSFNNPGQFYPLTVGSKYPSNERIETVIIEGTAGSVGDEIVLMTVDFCLPFAVGGVEGIQEADGSIAEIGKTYTDASTDSVQTIEILSLASDSDYLPTALFIKVLTNDLLIAFDIDPDQAAGFGYRVSAGDIIRIYSADAIKKLRFISATAASPADLTINPEY